ncbi:MAG: acetate--CoA ligase family protein [Chloroflexota bacterium]
MEENWKSDLETFFNPRSIAIVGATEVSASYPNVAFDYLCRYGYQGPVYPVNPRRDRVWGIPAFKTVSAIDAPVDQAIIAVAANLVPDVLEECGSKGIKSAVIFSSGFSEVDEEGVRLQEDIRKIAERYRLRVCGPNSTGYASLKSHTVCYSAPLPAEVKPGNVGFVSQSGMMSANILYVGIKSGIGFRYVVSSGNEAVLDFSDYIRYMLYDPEIRVVAAFVEGIRDAAKFLAVARLAADAEKPFLVLKIGKSEKGSQAAASHTGSLAGAYAVHQAVFRQAGVTLIESIEQFAETIKLFSFRKPIKKGGLAIISGSGGVCGYLADRSEEVGLAIPDFPPDMETRLAQSMPSFGTVHNPLDMTGQSRTDIDLVARIARTIMEDDRFDILLFGIGLTTSLVMEFTKPLFLKFIEAARVNPGKLCGFISCNLENFTPELVEFIDTHQLPLLQGGPLGLKAVKDLLDYNRFLNGCAPAETEELPLVPQEVRERWRERFCSGKDMILEGTAKDLLDDYGIRTPRRAVVRTLGEAKTAAASIGYPLVLKIQSAQLLHKTEAGGVKLNLGDELELARAFGELQQLASGLDPQATFLLEEMVRPGVEMILGLKRDELFGPVLLLGAGGIYTELYRDIALRALPLASYDADAMIREVRAFALLNGFRGRVQGDVVALADAVLMFAELAADLAPFVAQIDINPLVILEQGGGVVALDALFLTA